MTGRLAVHAATGTEWPQAAALLAELLGERAALVALVAGHDADWEQQQMAEAGRLGLPLLPVRLWGAEVEIGPLWQRDAAVGCPLCQVSAHLRTRGITDPPRRLSAGPGLARASAASLAVACGLVRRRPPGPGETVVVGPAGSSRHRVLPQTGCPGCGGVVPGADAGAVLGRAADEVPGPNADADADADGGVYDGAGRGADADSRRGPDENAGRGADPTLDGALRQVPGPDLSVSTLTALLVDSRYGPVIGLQPVPDSPASLVAAVHARHGKASEAAGYGRGRTIAAAARLALLERLERSGSEAVVSAARPVRATHRELPGRALDPRQLGHLAPEQYDHPSCRVDPFSPDDVLRWIPALVWGTDEECWVPLEAGSYHVHPEPRPGQKWGRVLYESSNGCALGATLDEAALHALLELLERDAFLLTWWAGRPVPRIDWRSVTDPTTVELRAAMRRAGYEVDLLVLTRDVPVPAVWALARNPRSPDKYSLTTAAAHPDPAEAVRAAVAELAPLVLGDVVAPSPERARRLRTDRWGVTDLDHHIEWYSVPEAADAFEPYLTGPSVPLAEAFPHSPLLGAATLGQARRQLLGLLADAGMDEVLVVDQTGHEHRAAGLRAVRVLVPGSVPLAFGFAHQRVLGLPRLLAAAGEGELSLERLTVHPFP
ncbi:MULTISPECIES: YcaO-like family protein [unclassified Streptomyces]|uniref:YcaO-like family protein n=1 Tax=unclassified Streptomyces TaxID=2593676 RepID=UPI002E121DF2|nr:YcaO-like family protein [Streptomyces sp. NBC_01207]WTA18033.1 YcaO-like family protein [Streptomyces sp. NBC_00853]